MVDLHIKNGTVVTPDGAWPADVLIQDGRIAGVVGPATVVAAARVLDATGLHVLPGAIDPHTHLPNRGRSFADSCDKVSRTQVAGGVTSALSFIFAPEGSYVPVLEELAAAVREHSLVDMGGIPILMNRLHVAEIPELTQRFGISSYKVFPFNAGNRVLYPKMYSVDDGLVWLAMKELARQSPQPLLQVHGENHEIAAALAEDLQAAGRTDAAAWTEARPNVCEEDALRQFSFWLEQTGASGYAVHLTSRNSPRLLAEARGRGVQIYTETCPQYLTLWDKHPKALMAKYQPALKEREDVAALWTAIGQGLIHCIGSDHIPVTMAEKFMDRDIWGVSGAAPNSGTILPVLLHYGVHQGRIGIHDVVRTCSYNTARIFGLYPQKGSLIPGADADLTLVDLKQEVTVTPELLNCDFSFYDGERFTGWPRLTLVSGRVVCEDGRITAPTGGGRELRRRPAAPVLV